jgi:carbonic anhydrase
MQFQHIFENNEHWIQEKLSLDPLYFEKLSKGQNPEFLYIGCSDSRVTAEDLMGLQPGEIFVHRNIANQIIPKDNNINAVIQYAVEHLKVKHIIVCGHYECGGIKAALHPNDMGQLNSWLQTIRDVYRLYKVEIDTIGDEQKRFDALVELMCVNNALT